MSIQQIRRRNIATATSSFVATNAKIVVNVNYELVAVAILRRRRVCCIGMATSLL